MPTFFLLLLLLAFAQSSFAQNNILRGQVVYLNSGKQPAVGVNIAGYSATSGKATNVFSNAQGQFQLVFPNSVAGDLVDLTVGKRLQDGQLIEIVNRELVEHCRIPNRADQSFRIVVCPKGARDLMAQQYYHIIKTSADRALEEKERELSRLLRDQNRSYDAIAQLSKDLERLQGQTDSVAIYREALRLASINKDYASERTLAYLKRIEAGETIQEALGALDIRAATQQLRESVARNASAREELNLRAQALYSIFRYKEAAACYDSIITALELDVEAVHPLLLGEYYHEMAITLDDNGTYSNALQYALKDVVIQEQYGADSNLAAAYNTVACIYSELGYYEEALNLLEEAIAIRERTLCRNTLELALLYSNTAHIYYEAGNLLKSLQFNLKSINIKEQILDSTSQKMHNSYNNISLVYHDLDKLEKALFFQEKAIFIQKKNFDSINPYILTSYNNLATLYRDLGKLEVAIHYHLKAISIGICLFDSLNPKLSIIYNNTAITYRETRTLDLALKFHKKALLIQEYNFGSIHPYTASIYSNIAETYSFFNESYNSILFYEKSIPIREFFLILHMLN